MKRVLYFLAGVAVGSAVTYFAVKGYFEQQAERRIQEEVDSVREAYQKRAAAKELADKNSEEKRKNAENHKSAVSYEELGADPDDLDDRHAAGEIQRIHRQYSRKIFDTEAEDEVEDETIHRHNIFDDDAEEEHPTEGIEEKPYPISADEFANEKSYFDKITIYIYRDDLAVDEHEQIIDDLGQLIGDDNLGRLGDLSDEENVVLIRNEMRSADYELILMDEDYIPDSGIPVRDR